MATTTNLSSLKINYLTQEQYDTALAGGNINENEIYMTPSNGSGDIDVNDMTEQEVDEFVENLNGQAKSGEYRKLLWTNPSPTSDFAAQTISLDLSNYDEVEVVCFEAKTVLSVVTALKIPVGSSGLLQTTGGTAGYNSGQISVINRMCTVNNTGITIGACYLGYDGAAFTNPFNHNLIPYKIYGIRYERVYPAQIEEDDDGNWNHINQNYVITSKRSGIVTVFGESSGTVTLTTGQWNNIGTLPIKYRPSINFDFLAFHRGQLSPMWGQVTTDGVVRIFVDSTQASVNYWIYSTSFPVPEV